MHYNDKKDNQNCIYLFQVVGITLYYVFNINLIIFIIHNSDHKLINYTTIKFLLC